VINVRLKDNFEAVRVLAEWLNWQAQAHTIALHVEGLSGMLILAAIRRQFAAGKLRCGE